MKIYLVRHGETDCNVAKLYYGWTDCELNETGKKQAFDIAGFFSTISYDRVICSDLKRARQTAEILNETQKKDLKSNPSLRELHFGLWEGKTYEEIKEEYPIEVKGWHKDWVSFQMPQGESFHQFYIRTTQGFQKILDDAKEEETLVLVAHNGVLSILLCYLTGAGEYGFWRFVSRQNAYSLVSVTKGNPLIERINCPVARLHNEQSVAF